MERLLKHTAYLSLIIDKANQYYYEKKTAIISKIPPAIQPIKFNKQQQITLAYYEKESVFDYIGLVNMKAYGLNEIHQIGFKVFEIYGNYFSLKNNCTTLMDQYQLFVDLRGNPFILVCFLDYGEAYLLNYHNMVKYYKLEAEGKIKALTIEHFESLIAETEEGILDYLAAFASANII